MKTTFDMGGFQVDRVGFGAMQFPGPGVMGPPQDKDAALALLRRVLELGINHIDTAQFYGPKVSNELIREALAPYPSDLVIVSKTGATRSADGAWVPQQRPEELIADTKANVETLGLDRLPVMNLRYMPPEETGAADVVPFDEQLDAMRRLVDDGVITRFGVSTVDAARAAQAIDAGAVCVQNAYNLLARHDEPVLELCRERGVAYVPYFPLGSAFGATPRVDADPRVIAVAERNGITPAQVGLAWLLQHSENILLIPGTSSVQHLEENTAVRDITLSQDDVDELESPAR
nr:aldo/keto reductase [Nigerium massiliense]